jgi:hypothetical protein
MQKLFNRLLSHDGVELPPSSFRAPARESNKRDFKVQCPVMEWNFGLFRFESRLYRQSFGVKIRGSKPEKPGFHLASCNMQLLANYTKYYTAAIFCRKSLIYIGFRRAWLSDWLWTMRGLAHQSAEKQVLGCAVCLFSLASRQVEL